MTNGIEDAWTEPDKKESTELPLHWHIPVLPIVPKQYKVTTLSHKQNEPIVKVVDKTLTK